MSSAVKDGSIWREGEALALNSNYTNPKPPIIAPPFLHTLLLTLTQFPI